MSKQVQKRRGTSAEHSNFAGAVAEITVDTETNELVLGDGATQGGWRVGISRVTTSDLVNSVVKYPESDAIETCGFTTAGDGGSGKWKQNGVTGQTPSQTPAQLGDGLLNDASGNQWACVDAVATANGLGAVGDGVAADNAALSALLNNYEDVYIGKGNYRLENLGADTNAINVTLTKSLNVTCATGCNFIADQVDGDMIRIMVPSGGLTNPVDITWHGGRFDQQQQKNSQVIPSGDTWPPINPGTTNTADAIYITGEASGKNNFKKVDIQGVTTYAGEHWEVGGGDSGVFVTGAISTIIANNVFQGNRDLGYYGSAIPNQTDDVENSSQTLYGNKCISCFHGLGGKRSITGLQVTGNTLYNCVRGVTIEEVQDYTVKGAIIGNNSFVMCQVAARINNCYGTAVNNNTIRYHGCLDSNGDAINQIPLTVVAFQETNNSEFCHNTIYGENPLSATANPTTGTLFTLTSDSNVNKVADNDCSNWRRLGTALGDSNRFLRNFNDTGVNAVTDNGTNTQEIRYTGNNEYYRDPLFFADGSQANPSVARGSQPEIGLYFAGGKVGVTGLLEIADGIRPDSDGLGDIGEASLFFNNVYSERITLKSADGTRWKVEVDNSGSLVVTEDT